jgi:hypothetical protein
MRIFNANNILNREGNEGNKRTHGHNTSKNFHKDVSTGLCWFVLTSAGVLGSFGTNQHKPAQACTNILMEVFADEYAKE